MYGLIILGIAGLYFTVMFFVVRWAWRKGRADGGSVKRGLTFAFMDFLVVYLPFFWNHIPTLIKHRMMCAKDAGFTAYVPKEEWVEQNREAIDQLTEEMVFQQEVSAKSFAHKDFTRRLFFGGLLINEWSDSSDERWRLPVYRSVSRIRDAKTEQIIAAYVDYSPNSWSLDHPMSGLFPWSCFDGEGGDNPRNQFLAYLTFYAYLRGSDK